METPTIPGLDAGTGVLASRRAKFGDNPFLQMLVQELRSQTPLEPVDNGAFMEQMASFSSMDQQRELNDNLLKLLDYQGVLGRLQGLSESSSLLGMEISYSLPDGQSGSGQVESVFVNDDGEVRVRTATDEVGLREITGVRKPISGE